MPLPRDEPACLPDADAVGLAVALGFEGELDGDGIRTRTEEVIPDSVAAAIPPRARDIDPVHVRLAHAPQARGELLEVVAAAERLTSYELVDPAARDGLGVQNSESRAVVLEPLPAGRAPDGNEILLAAEPVRARCQQTPEPHIPASTWLVEQKERRYLSTPSPLTAAIPAMLTETRGRPDDPSIRRALARWGFNTKQRAEPPADVVEVLSWVAHNSTSLSALADATIARQVLHRATGRLDGKIAAASTARRHRTILANTMDYAVELNLLDSNPIRVQQPSGPGLVAFFGLMYYAGLRPEEAVSLSTDCVGLPPPALEDGWGELHLRNATPDTGREWTDDGSPRERRQLKHRADGDRQPGHGKNGRAGGPRSVRQLS